MRLSSLAGGGKEPRRTGTRARRASRVAARAWRWLGVLALVALLAAPGLEARRAAAQNAAGGIDFAPRPDWVLPAALPTPRDARIGETSRGRYYLLYDTQIRADGARTESYYRLAAKVLDPAAFEDLGRLTFDFDPVSTRLVLHAVTIWRDGEALDRLVPGAFQVVRQEPELYDGMMLGDLTAFAHLPDIRVGDVIDTEWSRITDWPLWRGGLAGGYRFDYSDPLEDRRLRVLTPADMPLQAAARALDLAPEVRRIGDEIERVWRRRDVGPVRVEETVPAWIVQRGFVEISSMRSWREVADWGRSVADVDMTLPEGALAKALGGDGAALTQAQKVSRVIRFVQDDIRYVGDEVGLGSHVPRPPARALALGYGDCKDKSLLLVAYLRALGLEAAPALTHSRKGRSLPQRLPSPFVFNHMIVRAATADGDVWIDPTQTHQGGQFPSYAAPDYGYALPLAPGQEALAPIAFEARPQPTQETLEVFDFADLAGKGLGLEVETTYRGREADWFRLKLVREARTSIADGYLDYYRELYPQIAPEAGLTVKDDREANVLVTRERYRMPADAFFEGDWRGAFPIKADALRNAVASTEPAGRRFPVALRHPLDRLHRHRFINLPDLFTPVKARLKTEAAEYTQSSEAQRDSFEIRYALKTRALSVAPGDLKAHNAFVEKVDDATYVTYSFMDRTRDGQEGAKGPDPAQQPVSRLDALFRALGIGGGGGQ